MTDKDLKTLAAKGIDPAQVESQLKRFETGFPYLEIVDSATAGNGIMRLTSRTAESRRGTLDTVSRRRRRGVQVRACLGRGLAYVQGAVQLR